MADLPIRCTAVAVVVLRQAPTGWQILLLHRTQPPRSWSQTAGAIEEGETAVEAATRQVSAQAGLTPSALYTTDFNEMFYEPDQECLTVIPVFVAVVPPAADVVLDDAHDDARWCSPADAVAMVAFPGQRAMLRHVVAEFVEREPHPLMRLA